MASDGSNLLHLLDHRSKSFFDHLHMNIIIKDSLTVQLFFRLRPTEHRKLIHILNRRKKKLSLDLLDETSTLRTLLDYVYATKFPFCSFFSFFLSQF